MKHLIIDTEQEAILRATLHGVSAFLEARASRRDPFGTVSKAYRLQERKCANLDFQLQQPPIAAWQQIDMARQGEFHQLVNAFIEATSATRKAVIYTQILAFITAQRHAPEGRAAISQKLKGEISE